MSPFYGSPAPSRSVYRRSVPDRIEPQLALARLREGNDRFVSGTGRDVPFTPEEVRAHADGQRPFAIILGCADSRVPAEIVFDQGIGDLFVIRVAGAIVAPSQIGSVEFAAASFDTPIAMVLGHTACGAIDATLRDLAGEQPTTSAGLRAIVDRLRPAIEPIAARASEDLPTLALEASVRASVDALRDGSAILRELEASKELQILGAIYDLASGTVTILD